MKYHEILTIKSRFNCVFYLAAQLLKYFT